MLTTPSDSLPGISAGTASLHLNPCRLSYTWKAESYFELHICVCSDEWLFRPLCVIVRFANNSGVEM